YINSVKVGNKRALSCLQDGVLPFILDQIEKIDLEKIKKHIDEQMKKIDADKIKTDVNKSIQQVHD
ncbi:MAG TPA: hypothetical protein VH396_06600, partial [Chitinophagaceae bacterium]